MAAFQAMKSVAANGGAVAVLTGFFSSGIMYAGKKAIAAEREPSAAADNNDGTRKLSYAPQFDGLECFETLVSTGKHPRSGKQPSVTGKSVPKNHDLAIAPQFDGLHCFETFIYKN